MRDSLPRIVAIVLAGVLLMVVVVFGVWNGWFLSRRIPVQQIRDLHDPAIERQHQIEDLANPPGNVQEVPGSAE